MSIPSYALGPLFPSLDFGALGVANLKRQEGRVFFFSVLICVGSNPCSGVFFIIIILRGARRAKIVVLVSSPNGRFNITDRD